ncbi:MAG: DUF5615 family PIN-like protein [Dethiobacteria bacterium]|jgi:predicted nuclease of predicted toxin-antitoxin system
MSNGKFKFKIDENLPIEAAKIFTRFGYNAETVLDEELLGSSDDELFQICKKENRILITFDLDFSGVRTYTPGAHPGVIVIRLDDQSVDATLSVINKIISTFKEETPYGKLWIVEEKRIRIRNNE